jgi:hypothetical protein
MGSVVSALALLILYNFDIKLDVQHLQRFDAVVEKK